MEKKGVSRMETNILGLPSLTGFTPLKARQEGQVLKYDFKGIGPRVLDKSGNFNGGTLKPRWPVNSPRRSIPPKTLAFDGEDDWLRVPESQSLNAINHRISIRVRFQPRKEKTVLTFRNMNWRLETHKGGTLYAHFVDVDGNRMRLEGGEVDLGTWCTAEATYPQGENAKLILDGEVVDTQFAKDPLRNESGNIMRIGSWAGNKFNFEGLIDSIKISGW